MFGAYRYNTVFSMEDINQREFPDKHTATNVKYEIINAIDGTQENSAETKNSPCLQEAAPYRQLGSNKYSECAHPSVLREATSGDSDVVLQVDSMRYIAHKIPLDISEEVSLKRTLSDNRANSPAPDSRCFSSPSASNNSPYLSPSCKSTPLSTDQASPKLQSCLTKTSKDRSQKLPMILEYASLFAHLATFGVIGVQVRYWLEELFGPTYIGLTQTTTALFSSLPANMVGCFFMGWVGIVWKKDISHFSEHLAVGLSTGLMGSITTFASWNQTLLNLITAGYWVRGLFGYLIGMGMSQISLVVGIDSAKAMQLGINYLRTSNMAKRRSLSKPTADNLRRRQLSLFLFVSMSAVLLASASILVAKDGHSLSRRRLWLACIVAPPGVWIRWFLARYNGQDVGSKHTLKWFPVGTFATNIIASNFENLLSLLNLKVHNYSSALATGALQLGLLGCMSTVSTMVTEVYFLHQDERWWRAYIYAFLSIFSAFITGIILYSICVWVDGYKVL